MELGRYTIKMKKKVNYYKRLMSEMKVRDEVSSGEGSSGSEGEEVTKLREAFEKSEEIRR